MAIKLGAVGLGGAVTPKEVEEAYRIQDESDLDVEIVAGSDISYKQRMDFAANYLDDVPDHLDELSPQDLEKDGYEEYREIVDDQTFADYRKMLDTMVDVAGVDDELAVMISVPHGLHKEMTDYALERGAHVLIEKPIVVNDGTSWNGPELAADTVQKAADNDLVLHTGFQRRFKPEYTWMRDAVKGTDGIAHPETGDIAYQGIGDIEYIEAEFVQPDWAWCFNGTWRTDRNAAGGGELFDTGQHLIDLVEYITDANADYIEVDSVVTFENADTYRDNDELDGELAPLPPLQEEVNYDGVDIYDRFTVDYVQQTGDGENQFTADITVDGHDPSQDWWTYDDVEERVPREDAELATQQYFRITGEYGDIELETVDGGEPHITFNGQPYDDISSREPDGRKMNEFLHAIDAYQRGEPYHTDAALGDDAVVNIAIAEAVMEASQNGGSMDLQEYLEDAGRDLYPGQSA